MKTDQQRRKTTTGASTKGQASAGLSGTISGTSATKAVKQRRKTTGKSSIELTGQPLPSLAQPLPQQTRVVGTGFPEKAPGLPTFELRKSPQPVRKFKLQLFPIDEVTHKMLEKDEHNPYLELTLGTQKKISSVVKHLNVKWGNSKTASGELMLFPYNARLEDLASHRRWTLKDFSSNAADVFAAIGSPTVFRLRYGWFSNLEPKACGIALKSPHSDDSLQTKESPKMINTDEINQPCPLTGQECKPMSIDDSLNQGVGTPTVLDRSVQVANILRMGNSATLSWADCFSNISMGSLLSEASPTPDANHFNVLPVQNNPSLQQIPISCDSFDAAINAHIACFQATNLSTHSSIWDAEETCHAFSFQKNTSSSKYVPASKDTSSTSCGQNFGSNSMKFHDMLKLGLQVGTTQDHACQKPASNLQLHIEGDACREPSTDLQLHMQDDACKEPAAVSKDNTEGLDNASRNFGMIPLPDSLGPFGYYTPSSRQIIGGDSLSGLIASSLDAFQNCSFFNTGKVQST